MRTWELCNEVVFITGNPAAEKGRGVGVRAWGTEACGRAGVGAQGVGLPAAWRPRRENERNRSFTRPNNFPLCIYVYMSCYVRQNKYVLQENAFSFCFPSVYCQWQEWCRLCRQGHFFFIATNSISLSFPSVHRQWQ